MRILDTEASDVFFLKNAQVGSGALAWASGTEYREIFPPSVKWMRREEHSHTVPRLRVHGAIPPVPLSILWPAQGQHDMQHILLL